MISYGLTDIQTKLIETCQKIYPVNMSSVANTLGISTYKADLPDDVSGLIRLDKADGGESGYAIYVNWDHHVNRRRFTIAHEIAHFLLHKDKIGDGVTDSVMYRAKGMNTLEEIEANKLAAALLMPANLIDDIIDSGETKVKMIAAKLKVSEQAFRIRMGIPS